MKIRPVGTENFPYGKTDRRIDMKKLIAIWGLNVTI